MAAKGKRRCPKFLKTAGGIALAAAIVSLFAFGGFILNILRHGHDWLEIRLGERLCSRHNVVLLADFDDATIRDAVTTAPFQYWDVERVRGKFGDARRIDLDGDAIIQSPITHHAIPHSHATCAAWFKPRDTARMQTLFEVRNSDAGFQLTLSTNRLSLLVLRGMEISQTSCAYSGTSRSFTHVAVAIRKDGASIFQNGVETASMAFPEKITLPPKPLIFGTSVHSPFEGDIDDLAVWKMALDATDLKSIVQSRHGLKMKYEPLFTILTDATAAAASFAAGFYRTVGRLAPPLRNPAQIAKGIPAITAWPSKNDARHFLAAHEASLHSGFRTRKAANFRSVDISSGGTSVKAEVALDDTYGKDDAKRMAFIVRDPTHTLFGGSGLARLYPPELHEALHPDAPFPLPLSGEFVRFYLEDSFKGLYVVETFDRLGGAWMARGKRDPNFSQALYFSSDPSECDFPPAGAIAADAYVANASLALSDILFPWGRQEISARKMDLDRRRAIGKFTASGKSPNLGKAILGGNLSPLFVTEDLALESSGRKWKSSDPALISDDGRVTRPSGGAPRPVLLTPLEKDAPCGEPIRFRVVPLKPDLQTLFIHVGFPVEKFRRSDFSCLRFPAGGGEPEWLTGTGGNGGGIKHRGNTSYVKGAKRSFSLEFDGKVAWPGSSRMAQHVLLFSGYADPTRLRNKVSFDSFRLADSAGVPCGAIDVSWSEVFINGEYFGVWETCRRAKDICDPKTYLFKIRARDPLLWKTTRSDMSECISSHNPRVNPYRPLESLFEFTSGSSTEDFAAHIADTFYIESLIDYYMMLNFSENYDGQVTNQYIGRRRGDDRWFIIPWDYDKTFFDGAPGHLANHLVNRLLVEMPEFRHLVSEKWANLRQGPMAEDAVLARINSDAALLAPYMEEEYRLLQPAGWNGDFEAAVERLRQVVSARLKLMDAKFTGNKGNTAEKH